MPLELTIFCGKGGNLKFVLVQNVNCTNLPERRRKVVPFFRPVIENLMLPADSVLLWISFYYNPLILPIILWGWHYKSRSKGFQNELWRETSKKLILCFSEEDKPSCPKQQFRICPATMLQSWRVHSSSISPIETPSLLTTIFKINRLKKLYFIELIF